MSKFHNALTCIAIMFGYDLSTPKENTLEFIEPIPDYDIPQNPNGLSDAKFVKTGNGRIYDREKLAEEVTSHPGFKDAKMEHQIKCVCSSPKPNLEGDLIICSNCRGTINKSSDELRKNVIDRLNAAVGYINRIRTYGEHKSDIKTDFTGLSDIGGTP